MLRHKLFWISLALLLGAASLLAVRPPRATANITLLSFTAIALNGQPEIFVKWETATEIGVAGFYVQRSLTNQPASFANISPFMPAEGGSLTGAVYNWLDDMTTLNTAYYYRLQEIPTDATRPPIVYEPVMVIAGVAATPTPTPPSLIYLPLAF